ncbi:hypothetical protein LY04_02795 [Oceanimonas baumannii]|uniref:Glycosyltransferase 2-like domain-containing protein n=2 Tax=Oceanimonas baumannii TaxID=129578 RepID=A0ABY2EW89_9GAMM|nr:hypothetical protein LY04_02795 [Oceanimonas baumannii]
MNKKVWVVLGMHRSGTSVLSRALAVLGAEHGDKSRNAAADNPKGFWEDEDLVAFNDGLLAELGKSWFDLAPIEPEIFNQPEWRKKKDEAKALFQSKLSSCNIFALKDPRLSCLLPFWKPVWDELALNVQYLFSIREPEAVAHSLNKRNGFSTAYSAALWLRYLEDSLTGLDEAQALIVDYQHLLHSPYAVLSEMAGFLEVELEDNALNSFSNEFLDKNLDHGSLDDVSPILAYAKDVYLRLAAEKYTSSELLKLCESKLLDDCKKWPREARHTEALLEANSLIKKAEDFNQMLFDTDSQLTRLDSDFEQIRLQCHQYESWLRQQAETQNGIVSQQEQYELWLKQQANAQEALFSQQEEYSSLFKIMERVQNDMAEQQEKLNSLLHQPEGTESVRPELIEKYESKVKEVETLYEKKVQELSDEISILKKDQMDLLARYYWKRKMIKRMLVSGYSNLKPKLGFVSRRMPAAWKQRIKIELEKRLFNSSSVEIKANSNMAANEAKNPELLASVLNAGKGSDIVVFPVIDWSFRIQRPQHLARELAAAGQRVFYLSTTFNPENEPGFVLLEQPAENVFLCQLNLPGPHPVIYQDVPEGEMLLALRRSLNMLAQQVILRQPVAIIDLPFWHKVADALPGALQVYDCMDHHAGFSTNSEQMHGLEKQLLHEADLVITTASRLSHIVGQERDNVVIRNGAEVAFFSTPCKHKLYQSERPVVGYYGAISEWFDMELVIASARAYPEWDFVLVGNTFGCDTEKAEKQPNIYFTGEVPYTELPGYLAAFDVCTIPFQLIELTLCTNPVKVYEYLAAGKPVVTTAMPELQLISEMVHVADNEESYIAALSSAMDEVGDAQLADERSMWARQHDWASRAAQLKQAIDESYPKVSVIVLTYNNLELTQACLSSIERFSDYPNLELILVDNASSDGTPDFLQKYAADKEHVKVCLNDENLGFSAGNNVGLAAATGDYLVILNNDTFVTQGWVHGLVRALKRDSSLGLVGPVTNNIGNEARINIYYSNMEQMAEQAAQYTQSHAGEVYPARCAAFFCVMFSRETYLAVGPMDEDFGVGFFEDDDYCNRVRQLGLKVGVVEDVFVHHHLSASFNKLKAGAKQALFERNKAIYESKWGEWQPHTYRPGVN